MSRMNGKRAKCQEAPELCATPLGSSRTSEIMRQRWKIQKMLPTTLAVRDLGPWGPRAGIHQLHRAQQRMESCVQQPGPLLPPTGIRQVPDLGGRSQRRATDIINLQRLAAARLHLCRPRGTCSHAGKSDPSVA